MYRASAIKWLHPTAAVPRNSAVRDDLGGAMHTPLAPARHGRSVTFSVPANLLPLHLGCSLYIGGDDPHFEGPKRGSHCTVPMGMGAGDARVLGARVLPGTGAGETVAANFALVSRIASTPRESGCSGCSGRGCEQHTRGGVGDGAHAGGMTLRIMRLDANNHVLRSMDVALDPVTNRTGDVWHVTIPQLSALERVAYGWVVEAPEGWSSDSRVAPGQVLLDPYADAAVSVTLPEADGGATVWAGARGVGREVEPLQC